MILASVYKNFFVTYTKTVCTNNRTIRFLLYVELTNNFLDRSSVINKFRYVSYFFFFFRIKRFLVCFVGQWWFFVNGFCRVWKYLCFVCRNAHNTQYRTKLKIVRLYELRYLYRPDAHWRLNSIHNRHIYLMPMERVRIVYCVYACELSLCVYAYAAVRHTIRANGTAIGNTACIRSTALAELWIVATVHYIKRCVFFYFFWILPFYRWKTHTDSFVIDSH